ncbi:anthranilate phosphoribosyltransferase [Clostridium grantii]|uniref:Anthranilate phosphoribosyltransferase n=1 Tax=Clostridium grantii DSM 8605 TaxID=1121316 RepID=A0A1M5XYN1_9CLOT|nr:anthranilate phosphoribosyltransferase [Clostridium grantii]SHI04900.1 anthranilate phosphoribosyltransferase [Clostridium grantii DSM 8605]
MLKDSLLKLVDKKDLSQQEMMEAVEEIMQGQVSEALIASFLTALKLKGETVDEITGGAKAMIKMAEGINVGNFNTLDTCGTGGDKSGTYNISTASAFICAAAGVKVVKHGNRSVSSLSGSADVLEKLGVNISLTPDKVANCIEETNLGFLFAPTFHSAMRYAAPVRKQLGYRTVFNILGPLTNPARAKNQVLGVFSEELTEVMANVLKNLGVESALVVHGMDGLDEITLTCETKVTELKNNEIKTYYISPEDFGIERKNLDSIKGGNAEDNSLIIKDIFKGKEGAKKDILVLNAAAGLYVAGITNSLKQGVEKAREIIESGLALNKLNEFSKFTMEV